MSRCLTTAEWGRGGGGGALSLLVHGIKLNDFILGNIVNLPATVINNYYNMLINSTPY
jgi:hypothetical protein